MYARCLLRKLGRDDDLSARISEMVHIPLPADGIYPLVSDMFETMLAMVKAGESWHLPESRYGDKDRPILQTHPKEVTFALREAINIIYI